MELLLLDIHSLALSSYGEQLIQKQALCNIIISESTNDDKVNKLKYCILKYCTSQDFVSIQKAMGEFYRSFRLMVEKETYDVEDLPENLTPSSNLLYKYETIFENISEVLKSTVDNNEKIDKITDILL